MRIARAVAREQIARGAMAVVLTGSHARGDAGAHSDIDLVALYRTLSAGRLAFDPDARRPDGHDRAHDGGTRARGLPGSGSLHDVRAGLARGDHPRGCGRAGRAAAGAGASLDVGCGCRRDADEWVADGITGWAEEVLKLGSGAGRWTHASRGDAAVASGDLSSQGSMAVRRRILCGTENVLWDLVCERMGEPWSSAQKRALGLRGESVRGIEPGGAGVVCDGGARGVAAARSTAARRRRSCVRDRWVSTRDRAR